MSGLDPARYVLSPGAAAVVEDADIDAAGLHDASGQPITEASLEAEALEAEARQRQGLIPGGKSLSGDGSHSPILRVVVSQQTADQVRANAASKGTSVSKYLRGVIERAVS